MTRVGEFISQAELSCESCDLAGTNTGEAMVHAMTTGHSLTGKTPEGHEVTVSIEQE
jgi:hypothetical protein